MSNITFECPGCQQVLETPVEMAGQVVECPVCHQEIIIPSPEPQEEEPALPMAVPVQEKETVECHECGAEMDADAVLCINCGFHKILGKKIETELS